MATPDDDRSPFTRPAFITAAIAVALVVVLGIVIAVLNTTRHHTATAATAFPTPSGTTPTVEPRAIGTAPASSTSVCGLKGEVLSGTLMAAPAAEWKYQGTVAYPTSKTFGPAATDPSGFNYCFQRSPQGALFAAAHAMADATTEQNRAWAEYFMGEGPYRTALLSTDGGSQTAGTRLEIKGFRVLAYDGKAARIELAGRGSTSQGSITFSAVYELVWQSGDWKANAEKSTPFDFAVIPDLAGYIPWGA